MPSRNVGTEIEHAKRPKKERRKKKRVNSGDCLRTKCVFLALGLNSPSCGCRYLHSVRICKHDPDERVRPLSLLSPVVLCTTLGTITPLSLSLSLLTTFHTQEGWWGRGVFYFRRALTIIRGCCLCRRCHRPFCARPT